MMRLYNTLTGTTEAFTPLVAGRLGIYVCGVTPYSESHIGHAMSAIVYDVLVRYLRWRGNSFGGLDVTYVSNYTDVDDKLIVRGHELGIDPLDLADQNIAQWEAEQAALGLTPPDVRPRVTREIASIIALTERLVANGHAYATPAGDVYFRVRADEDYGKLSHRNIEDLRSGTTSRCGRPRSRGSRTGPRRGARGGRAGTSSAPRWRSAIWATRSTSTAAGWTSSSRTTRTRWRSRSRRRASRSRGCGCITAWCCATARRCRSRWAT
jgi:cysteinyl-tRNA synthetase